MKLPISPKTFPVLYIFDIFQTISLNFVDNFRTLCINNHFCIVFQILLFLILNQHDFLSLIKKKKKTNTKLQRFKPGGMSQLKNALDLTYIHIPFHRYTLSYCLKV